MDDITTLVFSALRLIESKGIESWRFEEQQRLNDIAFRFKQKMPTVDYVSSIASDLHYFPAADVLRGPYHLEKFDPQLIRRFLGYVTPDNVLVTLIAQGLPTDRSDPWYATPYRVTAIDKELLRRWRTERTATLLALPVRNVFIPKLLDVKRAETPPSATRYESPNNLVMNSGTSKIPALHSRARTFSYQCDHQVPTTLPCIRY